MKHLLTIVGARPQFIKAAATSRVLAATFQGRIRETLLHTGQHYDEGMSAVFFRELGIPEPAIHLNAGSGSHAAQTAAMLKGIGEACERIRPDGVLVFGDTNSTLSGALAASKLGIPVFHVEAGLRSFNKAMPEEINRVLTDHVSTLLFSPTQAGIDNLMREGFDTRRRDRFSPDHPGVLLSGDVMYDNTLHFAEQAKQMGNLGEKLTGRRAPFFLATIHRNTNTDIPDRLRGIFRSLIELSRIHPHDIIIPLHPRTKKQLRELPGIEQEMSAAPRLFVTEPVSFLEMFNLESHASLILTDSGGVQKEAYFLSKPCVVLRKETEWVELPQTGACMLGDAFPETILPAVETLLKRDQKVFPPLFGDGNAAVRICEEIWRFWMSGQSVRL